MLWKSFVEEVVIANSVTRQGGHQLAKAHDVNSVRKAYQLVEFGACYDNGPPLLSGNPA